MRPSATAFFILALVPATTVAQLDPETVCENFAGFANESSYDCDCERYGTVDVLVNCSEAMSMPTCSSDNSTCYNRNFAVVMDPNALTIITQQCSYFTASPLLTNGTEQPTSTSKETTPVEQLDICFITRPVVPGNYSAQGMDMCSTTLNNQNCSKCEVVSGDDAIKNCQETSFVAELNVTGESYVNFDCTNVVADAKGTCQLAVSGVIVPNFDAARNAGANTTEVSSDAGALVQNILVSIGMMVGGLTFFSL
jgi:hypothetical protein